VIREACFVSQDAEKGIVEAVGPDFQRKSGERAFVSVEIVDAGGVFPSRRWNSGNELAG